MNFTSIDWVVIAGFLVVIGIMVFAGNRYTKSVADYLAAGRSGGRYMMTMASGMVWIGAINIVAMFELYHISGLVAMWWAMLSTPFMLYIYATGWGVYRLRETRALTVAQYLETRYSRSVRVLAGILAWVTGMINFGIFPAIGARFLIQFAGLPAEFELLGVTWQTFPVTMAVMLAGSLFFVFAGGQVTVLITDCLQGMFTQIAAVVIIVVLGIRWFDWERITSVLMTAEVGKSLLNPLDTGNIKDFDVFYFVIGVVGFAFAVLSYLQNQAYVASSKTAHEYRMGMALNQWRWQALCVFFMVLVLCSVMVMQHPDFAEMGSAIRQQLDTVNMDPDNATRKQVTITVALSHILPAGLAGLLCAIMLAALISTYDSFMHTWGAVFLQDVVMPFRKKPFASRQHIWLLRLSILGVAVFAFIYSLLFKNRESILMYFALVNNVWLGGSGAVILGGLYWKRGSNRAALVTLVAGALLGLPGIRTSGLLAFGVGTVVFYTRLYTYEKPWAVEPGCIVYLLFMLVTYASAERLFATLHTRRGLPSQVRDVVRAVLVCAAMAVGLLGLYEWADEGYRTLCWMGLAVAGMVLGGLSHERRYRWAALVVFAVALARAFRGLLNLPLLYTVLSLAGLGVALLVVSWFYSQYRARSLWRANGRDNVDASDDG